jgi:methyltransferase (TIGR00027 family)
MSTPSTQVSRSTRSRSAEGVAALRAIGHLEKDPDLRNPDHLAVRFLTPRMRLRVQLAPLRALTLRIVHRILPGGYHFITARTKHMDEIFAAEVHSGITQIAILGPGADSRAYRFADELRGATVFELDHPPTSEWKRRQVRGLFGRLPEHVRYVPIDLSRESLEDALAVTDRAEPIMFLWEGVTPYLSNEAIDSTLAAVGRCARGSSVAFDYFHPDASGEVPRYQRYLRQHGEPVVSRLEPGTLPRTLADHGLEVVSNVPGPNLAARHLGGKAEVVPFSAIAHARRA